MKTTLLKLAAIGFVLGMLAGAFVVIGIGFANGGSLMLPGSLLAATGSEAGALLAQMLVSGVFGAIPMAGVVFYEIESWGLLKQAVVHYATYTAAFAIIGIGVGWIKTSTDVALVAGIFAICHAIIWVVMYLRYKSEAEQLSALIQEAKQSA